MKKILLIEDDPNLAFMLIDGLENEGHKVVHINRGEDALSTFEKFSPNIVLCDVNLKGKMTGFEASRKLRERSDIPIIFTTARTQIEDLQEGFKIGNVDYLKKPYSIRELHLRITALLSRYEEAKAQRLREIGGVQLANFVFSPSDHTLQNIDTIHLQKNECTVLSLLCDNLEKVVTKKELLDKIWGEDDGKMRDASLNNIVCALRTKLSGDLTITILTVPKIGYKLSLNLEGDSQNRG